MTKPIVFFGTEDFSLNALRALVEAKFTIALVVTKPDSPQGRGHQVTPPAVKSYALEQGIAVLQPQKLAEIAEPVSQLDNPAGVLVSFGKIIPQSIIDLFHPGIINVHPSLLPKYRGPSPVEAAILNGDSETGVSIMQLSAKMDAGPIYDQQTVPLRHDETGPLLLDHLGDLGIDRLVTLLPDILNGSLQPTPQDDSAASYCHIIHKTDGIIDWTQPAVVIERKIRAYAGWPQCRTLFGQIEVIIARAHVVSMGPATPGKLMIEKDRLFVGTGTEWLEIIQIKPLGKKEMPVKAFLMGYKQKLQN